MALTDFEAIEQLNKITTYAYRYGNLTICVIGNIGNLLSAFVLLQKSWRKNVCVFYLLVDLLLSTIYLNSSILGTTLILGFNINLLLSNAILCKLFLYTSLWTTMLTPTILTVAAIDRLLLSSQNVDTRLYSSRRLAYFSVGIGTAFWLIFSLHGLIKGDIQHLGPTIAFCCYDSEKTYQQFISFSSMLFNIFFCFILLLLSAMSFKNVHRLRAIPRQQQQQRTRVRAMNKKDFQLLRCLFTQVIVYIICSAFPTGYSIYSIATRYQDRTLLQEILNSVVMNMLNLLYFTYHATSIFVFISISKAFRNELKRCVDKLIGKDLITIRTEDQQQQQSEPGPHKTVVE